MQGGAASLRNDHAASTPAQSDVLLEIVREISSNRPLPELLGWICKKTVEAFDLERATIFYHHARARGHVPLADHGTPAGVFERYVHSRWTLTETPHAAEIFSGRTVVLCRDDRLAPADRDLLDTACLHSLALLPLRTNDQTRGALSVGIAEPRPFTSQQIAGLEVVAHHAATAIYQARSLRASLKAARFRADVSALAVELSRESERQRAFDLLCLRAREMFGASAAALLLEDDDELRAVAADGDLDTAIAISLDRHDHPVVRAFRHTRVELADHDTGGGGEASFDLLALLAIPLIGDDAGGVLVVGDARNPRHFDPRVVEEVGVLGTLAGSVLRNVALMAQLKQTNHELRRVSRLKDEFLANVTHDLRTPLNIIIGYGQLAQEGAFGETGAELNDILGRMIGSAQQQLSLVADLLDLSRIELDRLAIRPTVVALAPLLEELEFTLSGMLRDRPVRALVHTAPLALAARADRERLRQVLHNLLGNAAKFTESGSVELWAEDHGDSIRIGVRDTGRGIADADRERIFEPFRQVEEGRTELGAGLGLAIARRLAVMMNGSLEVESSVGIGSTFWLTLPAAREEVEDWGAA